MNFISKSEKEEIQAREKELKEFEQLQKKQYRFGMFIVISFIALQFIFIIISCIESPVRIILFIVDTVLLLGLFIGHSWIRYLYAALTGMDALYIGIIILSNHRILFTNIPAAIYTILYFITSAVFSILLFKSNSVTEFLYKMKNG